VILLELFLQSFAVRDVTHSYEHYGPIEFRRGASQQPLVRVTLRQEAEFQLQLLDTRPKTGKSLKRTRLVLGVDELDPRLGANLSRAEAQGLFPRRVQFLNISIQIGDAQHIARHSKEPVQFIHSQRRLCLRDLAIGLRLGGIDLFPIRFFARAVRRLPWTRGLPRIRNALASRAANDLCGGDA
jgi:hypothetical protein